LFHNKGKYSDISNLKFVHYISDGSGRDFYVGLTEGGNSDPHRWRNQTEFRFRSSLRNHNPMPSVFYY